LAIDNKSNGYGRGRFDMDGVISEITNTTKTADANIRTIIE